MGQNIINIVVGTGSYLVALLSIYLGHDLIVRGAQGRFKFRPNSESLVGIESLAPGMALAILGVGVAFYATRKLITQQSR